MFKNAIYTSYSDYVLGGCSVEGLDKIKTPNSGTSINAEKLFTAFIVRIEVAVEEYLDAAIEKLKENGDGDPEGTAFIQLNELLIQYLGISASENSASEIAQAIMASEQYVSWFSTIKYRITQAQKVLTFKGFTSEQLAAVGEDEQSIDSAIKQTNLTEILETLTNYA